MCEYGCADSITCFFGATATASSSSSSPPARAAVAVSTSAGASRAASAVSHAHAPERSSAYTALALCARSARSSVSAGRGGAAGGLVSTRVVAEAVKR